MIGSGGVPLRISNTWAIVLGLAVLGLFGMIVALAFAGWEAEAIGGLFVGLAALAGAVTAAIRKAEVVEAKTDRQSAQLDRMHDTMATVERQTNGESERRIVAAVIAELRKQGVIP